MEFGIRIWYFDTDASISFVILIWSDTFNVDRALINIGLGGFDYGKDVGPAIYDAHSITEHWNNK